MPTHVYANNNEIASKASEGKSIAAFPDVCFSPPAPPVGPMPLPYPNTGECSNTDKGTTKVFIKDKMSGIEGDSCFSKSMGDEAATQNFTKGMITSALQGKCYFGLWSMDVQMEGKGVPRHLDMVTHNHASQPFNIVGSYVSSFYLPHSMPIKMLRSVAGVKYGAFIVIDQFGKPITDCDFNIIVSTGFGVLSAVKTKTDAAGRTLVVEVQANSLYRMELCDVNGRELGVGGFVSHESNNIFTIIQLHVYWSDDDFFENVEDVAQYASEPYFRMPKNAVFLFMPNTNKRHYLSYRGTLKSTFFKTSNFACNCCGELFVDKQSVRNLEVLSASWGSPIRIGSAHRCKTKNKAVGGARKSQHLKIAFDCSCINGPSQDIFCELALKSGFLGIGRYNTFVHIDMGPKRNWDNRTCIDSVKINKEIFHPEVQQMKLPQVEFQTLKMPEIAIQPVKLSPFEMKIIKIPQLN